MTSGCMIVKSKIKEMHEQLLQRMRAAFVNARSFLSGARSFRWRAPRSQEIPGSLLDKALDEQISLATV